MKPGVAALILIAIIATSACTESNNTLQPSPALDQSPTPTLHQAEPGPPSPTRSIQPTPRRMVTSTLQPTELSTQPSQTPTSLYPLLTRHPTRTPTPTPSLTQPLPADWQLTAEEALCLQPLLPLKAIHTAQKLEQLRDCSTKESIRMLTHFSEETFPIGIYECTTNNGILGAFSYFQERIPKVEDHDSRLEWALAFQAAATVGMSSCTVNRELDAMGFSEDQKMVLKCLRRNINSGTRLVSALILENPAKALRIYNQGVRTCDRDPYALWTDPAMDQSKTLYLSSEERDCVESTGAAESYFRWGSADPGREEALAVRACVQTESLRLATYLMDIKGLEKYLQQLNLNLEDVLPPNSDCIAQTPGASWGSKLLRTLGSEELQNEGFIALSVTFTSIYVACYPDDYLAALGAGPQERELLKCITTETVDGAELVASMVADNTPQALAKFDEAYKTCLRKP